MVHHDREAGVIRLNPFDTEAALFGFAGGRLLSSPTRAALIEAGRTNKKICDETGVTPHYTDIPATPDNAHDTAQAILTWRKDVPAATIGRLMVEGIPLDDSVRQLEIKRYELATEAAQVLTSIEAELSN